jgi:ribosomal protein S18 acetylase RimI-like enzyme
MTANNHDTRILSSLEHLGIRLIDEADLPALEWGGEFQHYRRLYRDVYDDMDRGKALMWVAELDGVGVIGQAFVQLSSSRTELADGRDRAYVFALRVKPAYRGIGVGAQILLTIEVDLIDRRYRWVNLNVGRHNQDAQRFYERLGYRVIAPEPGRWSYVDDRGQRRQVHEPAWRMGKQLSNGQVKG